MALAFAHRLRKLISILEQTGVLNSNFASAYEMKPARGSRYFLDLVLRFCNDMEAGLRELGLTLELPVVDYEKMFEHYLMLRRSARRIGACALVLATEELHGAIDTASKDRIVACELGLANEELRNAIDTASKDRCNLAMLRMRQEYQILRPHFGTIIELERSIIQL